MFDLAATGMTTIPKIFVTALLALIYIVALTAIVTRDRARRDVAMRILEMTFRWALDTLRTILRVK
ncbi:hypothetical protein IU500_31750 [Nocardia terpenica]|uniref:hypothetical protein n=2 Tax=Nocardia terpenica TaxID=455432 RepID=UPI001893B018|nr:hypothetical protein [Nocardia terpenica]MBF6066276.1 hypothetical protein [Nocardia terpenica]MBF6108594.1 hypothetical protein [Nocardia terpenica]MBF6116140.1 hypothetical protein [Nocardia terpenica]MBF6123739.1 hypothetical protein [Nocardia terpenica]MBF6157114.1 hypothetical protein [Nocardia terpenica]